MLAREQINPATDRMRERGLDSAWRGAARRGAASARPSGRDRFVFVAILLISLCLLSDRSRPGVAAVARPRGTHGYLSEQLIYNPRKYAAWPPPGTALRMPKCE